MPVGFAQEASIDLNLIPFALVDHIDILKDGASAIYGSRRHRWRLQCFSKHKFRGLEIEASFGNTNLGSSNDAAEREGHLLAGMAMTKRILSSLLSIMIAPRSSAVTVISQ